MSDSIDRVRLHSGQPVDARPTGDTSASQAAALAQQFEAMLLSQMLREMRLLESDDDSTGFGGSIIGDTMRTELGLALSRSGGIGMAAALSAAFARLDEAEKSGTADVPEVLALPDHVALPVDTEGGTLALPDAPVTSPFGWRTDPLNGQARFHHGTDLRMAYGQDVRSVGAGVVKAVSEAGGYGLMVAIDHGDGLETRYAHLSAANVRPGDTIAPGQIIARSGNSGRSTGPHLHFEVREDGQPVDPSRFAARLGVQANTD
jgi:murein DD-endopeptidase MepM/ murein hydrolase activator NlpD